MALNGASTEETLAWRDRSSAPANAPIAAPALRSALLTVVGTQQIQIGIGLAIRRRRRLIDMTLRALAEACDVSFQQIHKYEAGQCSVSAVQLWRIGCALGVPITYFFERVKPPETA
jgi:DNA-binding XRE family transcriptional regulator